MYLGLSNPEHLRRAVRESSSHFRPPGRRGVCWTLSPDGKLLTACAIRHDSLHNRERPNSQFSAWPGHDGYASLHYVRGQSSKAPRPGDDLGAVIRCGGRCLSAVCPLLGSALVSLSLARSWRSTRLGPGGGWLSHPPTASLYYKQPQMSIDFLRIFKPDVRQAGRQTATGCGGGGCGSSPRIDRGASNGTRPATARGGPRQRGGGSSSMASTTWPMC